MRQTWNRLSGRYAAMSRRERLIILAAAIVLAYAIVYALVLSPLLARQQRAAQDLSQRQSTLKQLREQLEVLTRAHAIDPEAAGRARLEQNRQRLKALEEEVEKQSAQLISPQRMRGVLEKFLASRPRLELAELKTLPRNTVGLLYKHGFELTLKGGYLDLLEYLRDVEGLPDRLYWDKLELSVQEYPVVTLKLTLYTVSLDRAWLLV